MKFTYAADAKPVDGFTIRRGIHRGGFGEVYYAVSDAGKEVALKLLTHDLDTELRGIRQCLNLKHPNLITIFDVRTDTDGDQWVVMEYVNGSNLEEVLTAFPHGLPLSEVRDWLNGIVAGVEYLHDRGLIHRDLKPANIYRENGVVKIGDVGLSKRFDGERRHQHTESIGTVYYMAPEITHGKYGPAVDVYSLGIILYELLTGKLPFNGETSGEILMKQLSAAPDLSIVPANLRSVLAHALEKDPQKRTPSARQLWIDFEQAQSPTMIPDANFVNGATLSDASQKRASHIETARRDTDKSRETHSRPHPPVPGRRKTPTETRMNPGPYARRHFGEFKVGLVLLGLVLMLIPWQSMSTADRWETVWLLGCFGGFLLFLLWAREHWRPDHEPPWLSPSQERTKPTVRSDWAGALAIGGLTSGVLAYAGLLSSIGFGVMFGFWAPPSGPISMPNQSMAFFVAAGVLGAWAVIAGAWLTEKFTWAERHPRFHFALMGLVLASLLTGLQDYLMLPRSEIAANPQDFREFAMFSRVGVNPLVWGGAPTWFGYAMFLGGVFFLMGKRFQRMQDPGRPRRWHVWPVALALVVAWFWSRIFWFPHEPGLIWIAIITTSVQLAAPWQPKPSLRNRN